MAGIVQDTMAMTIGKGATKKRKTGKKRKVMTTEKMTTMTPNAVVGVAVVPHLKVTSPPSLLLWLSWSTGWKT